MKVEPVSIGTNPVFGILTQPEAAQHSVCVLMLNAGMLHRVGPYRLYVNLAKQLAHRGFYSSRIDQNGKGDTPREIHWEIHLS